MRPITGLRLTLAVGSLTLSAAVAGGQPRNVILLVGDGMGPEQVKAATYVRGGPMAFEAMPYQGMVSTHAADSSITDSAAAATAIATGHKVNNGVISLALPGDGSELTTMLEHYQAQGLSTGLVTTTYMTHATPAAFGAHETSRNNTSQIAGDYLNQTRPNVLFGGGANGMTVGAAQTAGYNVVTNAAGLLALDTEVQTLVSGQFGTTHLPYELDGLGALPHLHEMTAVALNILDNDPDGFFLMVESGRIDHACHDNNLSKSVGETFEFSDTVQDVLDWAAPRDDTLVLVTADHETGGLEVIADNGPGRLPVHSWSTDYHTDADVPVYGWGPHANLLPATMNNTDFFDLVTVAGLPGDLNLDGFVGISDLGIVLGSWSESAPAADFRADPNGDGFVGIADLNAVLGHWNTGTPPGDALTIPAPSPGVAFFTIVLASVYRRYRHAS